MAELAEHPAAPPPRIGKQGDPCVMVIFGAAGDLTGRMLIPALYNLARASLLSREFAVTTISGSGSPAVSTTSPGISMTKNSTLSLKTFSPRWIRSTRPTRISFITWLPRQGILDRP